MIHSFHLTSALVSVSQRRFQSCLKCALTCLLVVCSNQLTANNLGIPEVQNFEVEAYLAAPQNWDIEQDEAGRILVANNKGLLVYNGVDWDLYPLPQQTILRSIACWNEGRILAGGQSEIGYFEPEVGGGYQYVSLQDKIPEADRLFEDVWDLVLVDKGFAFRSSGKAFYFDGSTFKTSNLAHDIVHLSNYKGKLLAQTLEDGLLVLSFDGNKPTAYAGGYQFDSEIASIIERPDKPDLVFTVKSGVFALEADTTYEWIQAYTSFLKESKIGKVILLKDGRMVIATFQGGGILLTDAEGRAQYNITKKQGLQNNTVLCLFEDMMGDLWLGLDNGIDLVNLSSPVRRFFPDGELSGAGYAALVHDDYIYFGTNYGLYRQPWKDYYYPFGESDAFELVKGSEGHVWGLSVQNGQLLMGHHEGAFLIEGNRAKKIINGGAWDFVSVPGKDDLRAVAGTYEGLKLLGKTDEEASWELLNDLEGLNESSRIIISDPKGWIWVTHPYRGVWKCQLEGDQIKEINFYGAENGFPSNRLIYAFDLGTEIVFCAEKGIYRYNETIDSFEPHQEFTQLFGKDIWLQKLVADPQGDLWFVEQDKVGLLKVQESSLSKEVKQQAFEILNRQLVGGHEFIYPAPDGNVFFATSKGFLQYREDWALKTSSAFKAMLLKVKAFGKKDSLLLEDAFSSNGEVHVLPSGTSTFQFDFSDNQFSGLVPSTYQYY